jgi:methylated-DNA-[protein]-cysteine S-methyltransferase
VRDVNASAARAGGADRAACAPFATPWGEGDVVVVEGRLAEVRLPWPGCLSPAQCVAVPSAGDQRTADHWARELSAYFAGRLTQWTAEEVGVDSWDVTPFRRAVYRALLNVPPGATVSYGELARRAGAPRAARAVGSAMAANPAPIVVPCHRVVRADGSPGSYGGCDAWKVELLRHEGAL